MKMFRRSYLSTSGYNQPFGFLDPVGILFRLSNCPTVIIGTMGFIDLIQKSVLFSTQNLTPLDGHAYLTAELQLKLRQQVLFLS